MESTATVRNIRNSTDSVISHMETVTWLQSCELLFLGRFAEDDYLPGIPLTPSVDICVDFTAENTPNHPTALISVELCTRFPTRFSMFGAPNTVFDTEYGTQLTFVSPSTLPYRPPLVPLRNVVRYFDNGFASRIDLVALAIHAVSVNTHIDRSTVAQTATRLAERLIMSNPPYLEFTSSQRRVVQDALPGFASFSAHGLGWWRRSFQ